MTDRITLRRFFDAHVHVRSGPMMELVVPMTAAYCSNYIVMPNLKPHAVMDGEGMHAYEDVITRVMHASGWSALCQPCMTIEIRDCTTPDMVRKAHEVGAIAGKVYPRGMTTNAEEGLQDFGGDLVRKTFQAMQEIGMPILLHGEIGGEGILITEREERFLPTLEHLAETYPKLKIVLEHVSSTAGVETVKRLGPNVAATITAHHLYLTLNDVIGDGVQPHHACMPIPKRFEDRDALLDAATSGNPKFFLGSDSAPHPIENKECAKGACGAFTAPALPELLVEKFEERDCLHGLDGFASGFASEFYGTLPSNDTITLKREAWRIPAIYNHPTQPIHVVPYGAGTFRTWKRLCL